MVHIWLCQVHVTLCVCVKTSMMISLSPLSSLSLSLSLSLCHAGIVLMQRLVDVVMNFVTSNTLLPNFHSLCNGTTRHTCRYWTMTYKSSFYQQESQSVL